MHLILGSQSPRRKEILEFFTIPFIQVKPLFDEDSVLFRGNPEAYACELSVGKAESLAATYPESVILTADTIVVCENKIYGKPKNQDDAIGMLTELSGKWHSVYTGVTVQKKEKCISKAEVTRVLFNDVTPSQIRQYINSISCSDKAGSYAIQTNGCIIVRKIDGCYYNVKGLPINTVVELLGQCGIMLWEHL